LKKIINENILRILKIKGHKTEESSAPAKLVLLEKLSETEGAKVNKPKLGSKRDKGFSFLFLL